MTPRPGSSLPLPFVGLSLFLLSPLLGCKTDYNISNDDGSGSSSNLKPEIEVSPSSLDFGSLDAGLEQTQPVTIRNVGTATLQLHSLAVEGAESFRALDDGLDRILAPGDEIQLPVSYAPITSETAVGTLWVESNDESDERVPVSLLATGLAPRIEITPSIWDMGDWLIGCQTDTVLTIRNAGTATLSLTGVDFQPTSPELSLIDPGVSGSVLEPGGTVNVTVRYIPSDTLDDAGYLYVDSNDPATPRAMATQQATGLLAERVIDAFEQAGNNWTDVLWVVDNSGSMDAEQESMATNFGAFMGIVESIDMDYHLAVVTTDNASFQEADGTRYIDLTTPNPEDVFGQMVSVGIAGSGDESGLKYGADALASPLVDSGYPNEGFLRDEAGLRIIFVSDEEDQSPSTVNTYVSFFQALKLNPDHVRLSGITGQLGGCSSASGTADPAPRYEQAVSDTGGISVSICASDWIDSLTELAWGAQSFQDTFPLSASPVVESIEVYLNSVPTYVGWYYDASLNSVIFEESHIPDNGDQIQVAYNRFADCEG